MAVRIAACQIWREEEVNGVKLDRLIVAAGHPIPEALEVSEDEVARVEEGEAPVEQTLPVAGPEALEANPAPETEKEEDVEKKSAAPAEDKSVRPDADKAEVADEKKED
jgi:hypothetical protein